MFDPSQGIQGELVTTCYGKPVEYGPITLVTAWEARGGGTFHNPRVILREGDRVLNVRPFASLRAAMTEAVLRSLDLWPGPDPSGLAAVAG